MPLRTNKLRETIRKVRVNFLNETVNVEYRLGAFNAEYSKWLTDHGSDPGSIREALEKVLVAWDVIDDDGQPVPTTVAAMLEHEMPSPFLAAVQEAIMTDAQPGKLRQ